MLALRECEIANGSMPDLRIEPATLDDLSELTELLHDLFTQEADFTPDREKQLRGLRLILEQPSRGRIFVIRNERMIVGMINLLITISTAEGGFVLALPVARAPGQAATPRGAAAVRCSWRVAGSVGEV